MPALQDTVLTDTNALIASYYKAWSSKRMIQSVLLSTADVESLYTSIPIA